MIEIEGISVERPLVLKAGDICVLEATRPITAEQAERFIEWLNSFDVHALILPPGVRLARETTTTPHE